MAAKWPSADHAAAAFPLSAVDHPDADTVPQFTRRLAQQDPRMLAAVAADLTAALGTLLREQINAGDLTRAGLVASLRDSIPATQGTRPPRRG